MQNVGWFIVAAVCEIAGCYTAWMWLRLGRSAWWLAPGVVSLIVFAVALTRVDAAFAGRAFAAYGGIYILSSLVWMAVVERTTPRVTDYRSRRLPRGCGDHPVRRAVVRCVASRVRARPA